MSKQTAVEWLVEQLLANALLRLTKDEHSVYKELKDLVVPDVQRRYSNEGSGTITGGEIQAKFRKNECWQGGPSAPVFLMKSSCWNERNKISQSW